MLYNKMLHLSCVRTLSGIKLCFVMRVSTRTSNLRTGVNLGVCMYTHAIDLTIPIHIRTFSFTLRPTTNTPRSVGGDI
jgi:hypothetical protein